MRAQITTEKLPDDLYPFPTTLDNAMNKNLNFLKL